MECVEGELWATLGEWVAWSGALGVGFSWLILIYSRSELNLRGLAQFRHFVKSSLVLGFLAVIFQIVFLGERFCSYA